MPWPNDLIPAHPGSSVTKTMTFQRDTFGTNWLKSLLTYQCKFSRLEELKPEAFSLWSARVISASRIEPTKKEQQQMKRNSFNLSANDNLSLESTEYKDHQGPVENSLMRDPLAIN